MLFLQQFLLRCGRCGVSSDPWFSLNSAKRWHIGHRRSQIFVVILLWVVVIHRHSVIFILKTTAVWPTSVLHSRPGTHLVDHCHHNTAHRSACRDVCPGGLGVTGYQLMIMKAAAYYTQQLCRVATFKNCIRIFC